MVYEVQLDSFCGPLDLLYELVKKNEIEINEISLSEITDQYLEYTDHFKNFNLDLATQFTVIASQLIELKANFLLPDNKEENDEESESDLVARLQQYHVYKQISKILNRYFEKGKQIYFNSTGIQKLIKDENELELEIDVNQLKQVYIQIKNTGKEKEVEKQPELNNINYIKKEDYKVDDKINEIINLIDNTSTMVNFYNLINNKNHSLEIVVTLLSILELMKLKKLKVIQKDLFEEIQVYK